MSINATSENPYSRDKIPTLDNFSAIQERVVALCNLVQTREIATEEIARLNRILNTLISSIRRCLRNPGSGELHSIFTDTLRDMNTKARIRNIYTPLPIKLGDFIKLSLAEQCIYLFSNQWISDLEGAVCHHWTIFWYNFWQECRRGTLYENWSMRLCQRTNNNPEMRYTQHSFLLLELEKTYLISTDGKVGVTMREATNFSTLEKDVFRTVRAEDKIVLEKIRTFKTIPSFAKKLDAIPGKELQLFLVLQGWKDQKV